MLAVFNGQTGSELIYLTLNLELTRACVVAIKSSGHGCYNNYITNYTISISDARGCSMQKKFDVIFNVFSKTSGPYFTGLVFGRTSS